MKVLREGHKYLLRFFENQEVPQVTGQTIQFIEKVPAFEPKYEGELVTVHDGTTNEEVLEMLIDRMRYLNYKMPCDENDRVIIHLQKALELLNRRTSKRKNRSVEGKHLK